MVLFISSIKEKIIPIEAFVINNGFDFDALQFFIANLFSIKLSNKCFAY